MNRYFGSLLLLFVVIRSTSTQECSLSNDCGVIGGKTRLFCKVKAPFDRRNLNWFEQGRELIVGGTIRDPAIIDLEEASDGFYLTILNTTKDDSGTYICEYSFVRQDCIVTQEDFQALMCEQKVDGHKMIITITYRLQEYLPKISLMKDTGEAINGRFDSVIDDGFLKEIVWRSDDLSVGTYNYKVTGKCGFLTACSGTVDIAEGPVTTQSTDVQATDTTVAPSELNISLMQIESQTNGAVTKIYFDGKLKLTEERIGNNEQLLVVIIVICVAVVTFVLIIVVNRFCFKRCFAGLSSYSCFQRFETEQRTGVKYCFSPQEAVSGQDVTVTAVKEDTASEKLVNSTDPDLETVDEIQTKKEKRSKLTEEEKKTEVPRDGEEQHENNNVATLVTFFQQT